MRKIHYATGGLITPEKSEFSTMCGRKFPKGTNDIMDSGYLGAQRVTCNDCREKLDREEKWHKHRESIQNAIARGEWKRIKLI